MSSAISGKFTTAPELAQWRMAKLIPPRSRTASMTEVKSANCARVYSSELISPGSSDTAKCVNTPSGMMPGSRQESMTFCTPSSKCAPEQRKPRRDIPVSSLMWILSVLPSFSASLEYSSALARQVTVWVMLLLMSVPVYSCGVWPRMSMGMVMPPSRSSSASSRQETAR